MGAPLRTVPLNSQHLCALILLIAIVVMKESGVVGAAVQEVRIDQAYAVTDAGVVALAALTRLTSLQLHETRCRLPTLYISCSTCC